ncbi:MAG: hypothetical protein H0U59_00030, partial [Gemmatimonadaceae bacterium]|nr:hypothetical protein [Gemmatimonadaceae bacterium]
SAEARIRGLVAEIARLHDLAAELDFDRDGKAAQRAEAEQRLAESERRGKALADANDAVRADLDQFLQRGKRRQSRSIP